jgi:hypothetical protein
MDRERYEEAKTRLEKVTGMLRHGNISPEERDTLEREGKELARVVISPWLPFDWKYRIVMIAFAAIGFLGSFQGQYLFMLVWLLLPLFSPRIVGDFLMFIAGLKDRQKG